MRYAQLVIGPAGSGKSTYCLTVAKHAESCNRTIKVVNLDPAAEQFEYDPVADVRELISLDDAMEDEELRFGPNGGLVFCMEYLVENMQWLEEQLGDEDDDYLLFDCPGQIELYTHMNAMRRLVDSLQEWNFRVCCVFVLDSQFMTDSAKFVSGAMTALSAMVNLELPHVNILSKMDLLSKMQKRDIERFLEPDPQDLLATMGGSDKFRRLSAAVGKLVEDYSLVRFLPLDVTDDESISDLLIFIDNIIQFGEDKDVKVKDFDPEEDDE